MFYQNYEELTWEEIEQINKDSCYLLLPLAAIEQHGKHLPIGTDDYILNMCMEELNLRENKTGVKFLCLPKISVGQSAEHMTFPGTLSFSVTTYQAMVHDIVASVAKHGFKKVIFVNGHGGNTTLLAGFSQELNLKYDVVIYNLELPAIYNTCDCVPELSDVDVPCDVHAGDIETSLLLNRCKKLVHTDRICDVPIYLDSFYNSWITRKISLTGTIGRPSKATEQRGKLILDYMTDQMVVQLEKMTSL